MINCCRRLTAAASSSVFWMCRRPICLEYQSVRVETLKRFDTSLMSIFFLRPEPHNHLRTRAFPLKRPSSSGIAAGKAAWQKPSSRLAWRDWIREKLQSAVTGTLLRTVIATSGFFRENKSTPSNGDYGEAFSHLPPQPEASGYRPLASYQLFAGRFLKNSDNQRNRIPCTHPAFCDFLRQWACRRS